jgi:hypothetical protein
MFIDMGAKGMPVIQTPDQLVQVLTTGRLEPVIEGTMANLMNIRAENEAMGEGRPVRALAIDHHPKHIGEHQVVLASPEARENEQVASAVLSHIQEHVDLWLSTNPDLLAALGIPPPPVQMPPPGPPAGPPGNPPGAAGSPPAGDVPSPDRMPAPEGMGQSLEGSMPFMPQNPQTGERAPMPGN